MPVHRYLEPVFLGKCRYIIESFEYPSGERNITGIYSEDTLMFCKDAKDAVRSVFARIPKGWRRNYSQKVIASTGVSCVSVVRKF